MKTETTTHNAVKIIDQITGDDPELRRMIHEETEKLETARLVYEARKAAGLTQAELARRVGTRQSVISQLEDADYEGHSLTMLARIAKALEQRVEVRFVPKQSVQKQTLAVNGQE